MLRIALGALLLADLAIRSVDFTAMYADEGFAPVALIRSLAPQPWWSLHLANGAAGYQAALFVAAAVLALMLLGGYRTRLATIGSWLLLASLHGRLPAVNNAGDTLLRVLLFWSIFLPLGRAWSMDARSPSRAESHRVTGSATLAYVLQLAIVYWAAGWAKWNDNWLTGDGVHDALTFGLYSLPLGQQLAEHAGLTRVLSVATVWLELVAPCLLFVPLAVAPLRLLLIVTFISFHLGIAATVTVGLFSYVAIAAWLALLPSEFWDRLRIGVAEQEPIDIAGAESADLLLSLYRDDRDELFSWRGVASAILVWLSLATVISWNLYAAANIRPPEPLRSWVRTYANTAMLRQAWGVFGRPPRERIWYVYEARLSDGRQLDLLTSRPGVEHPCPERAARHFANHRWRKLHWRLRLESGRPYRQPVAEYVTRRWNATHAVEQHIVELKLYGRRQAHDGESVGPQSSELLAHVVTNGEGGNFADAVRDLGAF